MPESISYPSLEAWHAEARRRFGPDMMGWRFVCPSCGHIASVKDWKDAGATEGEVAYSCVGRHLPNPKTIFDKPGPCNYAGGGLFGLNPVQIGDLPARVFDFASNRSAADA